MRNNGENITLPQKAPFCAKTASFSSQPNVKISELRDIIYPRIERVKIFLAFVSRIVNKGHLRVAPTISHDDDDDDDVSSTMVESSKK